MLGKEGLQEFFKGRQGRPCSGRNWIRSIHEFATAGPQSNVYQTRKKRKKVALVTLTVQHETDISGSERNNEYAIDPAGSHDTVFMVFLLDWFSH